MHSKKHALIILSVIVSSASLMADENEKNAEESALTKQDAALLRGIIYKEGLRTTINRIKPIPQREVALNSEMSELHKRKRSASLRLLLEIAKGGRPVDARAAAVTAIALEEDPAYAVLFGDVDLDAFDKAREDGVPIRARLVEQVEKILTKAEKEMKLDTERKK